MRTVILSAFALLLAPAAAQAGDLSGKVFDATALPVEGATVLVGDHEARTLADGTYSISGLPAGEQEVSVKLADGAVQTVRAQVSETGVSRRNIFLVSAAALRRAQQFAHEAAPAPAPAADLAADLPQLPAGESAMVAWRWRDGDA